MRWQSTIASSCAAPRNPHLELAFGWCKNECVPQWAHSPGASIKPTTGRGIIFIRFRRFTRTRRRMAGRRGRDAVPGTLIHREVVQRVGVPLTALFTHGDEVEYALRMMQAGYHIYVFLPSVVTHPTSRILFLHLFGRTFPCESMGAQKRSYSIRNSVYIRRMYYQNHYFALYSATNLRRICDRSVDRTPNGAAQTARSVSRTVRGAREGLATTNIFVADNQRVSPVSS